MRKAPWTELRSDHGVTRSPYPLRGQWRARAAKSSRSPIPDKSIGEILVNADYNKLTRTHVSIVVASWIAAHGLLALSFANLQSVLPAHRFDVFIAFLAPPLWRETQSGWGLASAIAIIAGCLTAAKAIWRPTGISLAVATIALVANSFISFCILGLAAT